MCDKSSIQQYDKYDEVNIFQSLINNRKSFWFELNVSVTIKEHPRKLIPELLRLFYTLDWVLNLFLVVLYMIEKCLRKMKNFKESKLLKFHYLSRKSVTTLVLCNKT